MTPILSRLVSADGFTNSDEGHAANSLLAAYGSSNSELLSKTLASHAVSYLDNEITRLSRTLKVPEGRTDADLLQGGVVEEAAEGLRGLQDEIEEEGIM
jgi:hypothetical protein